MRQYNDTDTLYHHGILGMKWGVRRYQKKDGSLTSAGRRKQQQTDMNGHSKRNQKKLAKSDKKWEKKAVSTSTYLEINNKSAAKINSKIDEFNSKWPNVNVNDPKMKKYNDRYLKAYGKMWDNILQETADEIVKTNPSGTKKIKVTTSEPGAFPTVTIVDVKKKG